MHENLLDLFKSMYILKFISHYKISGSLININLAELQHFNFITSKCGACTYRLWLCTKLVKFHCNFKCYYQ